MISLVLFVSLRRKLSFSISSFIGIISCSASSIVISAFTASVFNRSRSCFNSSRRFSTSSNTIPLVFLMYSLIILLHLVSTSVKKLSRSSSNDLNNVFKADFNQSSSMRMYSESHLPLPYELRFEQVHQTLGGRLGEYCFWYRLYEKPQLLHFIRFENKCLLLRFSR